MVFTRGKSGTVIASRRMLECEYEALHNPSVRKVLRLIKRREDKLTKLNQEASNGPQGSEDEGQ